MLLLSCCFCTQVEEASGSVNKIYRVTGLVKRATMHLAKGNYYSFARNAMLIPPLKKALVNVIASEVRDECQKLCTTISDRKSMLRKTSPDDLKTFSWSNLSSELHNRAPVFVAILEASVKRPRHQHPESVSQRSIGLAAAVLLHERNQFMCAVQSVISLLLHAGHAAKMVIIESCTVYVALKITCLYF